MEGGVLITEPDLTGDNEHPRFFREWSEAMKWCAENLPNGSINVRWYDAKPVDGNTAPVTYRTGRHNETIEEWWDEDGKLHRDRMPAQIKIFASVNMLQTEVWYQHGLRHREDGPATITTDVHGSTACWYHLDKLHRDDGPAIIEKDAAGNIVDEEWWIDGCHIDGNPIER